MIINKIDSEFRPDSFKLRIPENECKIINESILSNVIQVYEDTGEIKKSKFKERAYRVDDRGISIKYAIEKQTTPSQRIKTFITILITSKILKENYFDGITNKNKREVYRALIEHKVISFSYKSFLSAELIDVDFKKDIRTNDINEIINGTYLLTKEEHKIKEICRAYKQKKNRGIQWSERNTIEINKKPFFKIYQKSIEFKHNSTEFYETFIRDNDNDFDDIVRTEYTIKNKKHFRLYGINSTKLNDILNLSKESKNQMFIGTIEKHLDIYEEKLIRIKTDLEPNKKIILKLMDIAIKTEKYIPEKLLNLLVEDFEDKTVRCRKRKELKQLFDERLKISNKSSIKQAQIRQEIIDMLLS